MSGYQAKQSCEAKLPKKYSHDSLYTGMQGCLLFWGSRYCTLVQNKLTSPFSARPATTWPLREKRARPKLLLAQVMPVTRRLLCLLWSLVREI